MKALVAVELQLRSDLSFLPAHSQPDGIQNKIYGLLRSCSVRNNAVVIQIPDHGKIQHALFGMDVRDIRYPLAVWFVRLKLPIQEIFVLMELLAHLDPLPPSANLCQKVIFSHDSQDRLGIMVDAPLFQPQPHPPVTVSLITMFLLFPNDIC